MMDQEIKAQWLAALRSGEYKQGHGSLENEGQFCCLGVLCHIAWKNGITDRHERGEASYGGFPDMPPCEVNAWAGLEDIGRLKWLVKLNDGGNPFSFIADIIEKDESL